MNFVFWGGVDDGNGGGGEALGRSDDNRIRVEKNECCCEGRVTQGLASRYNAAIKLAGFACWVETRQRAR